VQVLESVHRQPDLVSGGSPIHSARSLRTALHSFQANPKLLLLGLSDDALPTLEITQHHTVACMHKSRSTTLAPCLEIPGSNLRLHTCYRDTVFVSFPSQVGKYRDSTPN